MRQLKNFLMLFVLSMMVSGVNAMNTDNAVATDDNQVEITADIDYAPDLVQVQAKNQEAKKDNLEMIKPPILEAKSNKTYLNGAAMTKSGDAVVDVGKQEASTSNDGIGLGVGIKQSMSEKKVVHQEAIVRREHDGDSGESTPKDVEAIKSDLETGSKVQGNLQNAEVTAISKDVRPIALQ